MDVDWLLYPYLDPSSQLALALFRQECKETLVALWVNAPGRIDNMTWLGYSGRKDVVMYVIHSEMDFIYLFKGACKGKQTHLVTWILKQPYLYSMTLYLSDLLYCGLKSHSNRIMNVLVNELPWQHVAKKELTRLYNRCEECDFAKKWLHLIFRRYKSFSMTKSTLEFDW